MSSLQKGASRHFTDAAVSVNRVWLIGKVATLAQLRESGMLVTIATVHTTPAGDVVERHLFQYSRDIAPELITGSLVLVEGRLASDQQGQRVLVVAQRLIELVEPVASESRGRSVETHGSPLAHHRVGHFRRIGIGTDHERLVWVRPTVVGRRTAGG